MFLSPSIFKSSLIHPSILVLNGLLLFVFFPNLQLTIALRAEIIVKRILLSILNCPNIFKGLREKIEDETLNNGKV